jgi:hypothetical protein
VCSPADVQFLNCMLDRTQLLCHARVGLPSACRRGIEVGTLHAEASLDSSRAPTLLLQTLSLSGTL